MKSKKKFKVTFKAKTQNEISDDLNKAIVSMRERLSAIEEIKSGMNPKDANLKIGAGYKTEVEGTIIFDDEKLSIEELQQEGEECFNETFKIKVG